MQEFTDFVESRRLYPWLWHHLYETNMLTNVNWGNMAGHQNWLMNSSGLALVAQSAAQHLQSDGSACMLLLYLQHF